MKRTLLATAALLLAATTLPAQRPGAAHTQIDQLSNAFASRAMAPQSHAQAAGQAHALQSASSLTTTRAIAHAPRAVASGPATRSASLDAFAPAAQSALAGSARAVSHAPAPAAPLTNAGAKMLQPRAGAATHAPFAKAKP